MPIIDMRSDTVTRPDAASVVSSATRPPRQQDRCGVIASVGVSGFITMARNRTEGAECRTQPQGLARDRGDVRI